MTDPKRSDRMTEGKERLDEIGRRLGNLFGGEAPAGGKDSGLFGGLGNLISQLGKLAEQAEKSGGQFSQSGEFDGDTKKPFKAVYGFTVKSGIGPKAPTIEPFGNVRRQPEGDAVEVHEIREPMVDLFDEPSHVLIVMEVPGIRAEDVTLELQDDVLAFSAAGPEKKYRKEVLLPESFTAAQMTSTCHNGVLVIRLDKTTHGE